MAVDQEKVAEKIFTLLKGFGLVPKSFDTEGKHVIDPREASRFAVAKPNILVRYDQEENSIVLAAGPDSDQDKLRTMLRNLAREYMLNFDYRKFDRTLAPKSETIDIDQKTEKDMNGVMEDLRKLAGLSENFSNYQPEETDNTTCSKCGATYTRHKKDIERNRYGCPKCKNINEGSQVNEGTWALPDSADKIKELVKLMSKPLLQTDEDTDEGFDNSPAQKLYNIIGNDELFDMFYDYKEGQDVRPAIKKWLSNNRSEHPAAANAYKAVANAERSKMGKKKLVKHLPGDPVDDEFADEFGQRRESIDDKNKDKKKKKAIDKVAYADSDEELYKNRPSRRINKQDYNKAKNESFAKPAEFAINEEPLMDVVEEGFGPMSGSTKTSYQGLDNVKIVVKHKKAVNEESRGARSRNIHSILIKRGDEKFRLPENNLKAARAMARHVSNGGEVYDDVGKAINEMASEHKTLKDFVRYVNKSGLVNEDNAKYVDIAKESINSITDSFKMLASAKGYASACENVMNRSGVEMLEDDIDLEKQFTETHFDDKVGNAVESIKMAMSRQAAFEATIDEAVQLETYANLRGIIAETNGMEFSTPHAKLSHQVSELSATSTNPQLSNYLSSISKKVADGGTLTQHEYTTVKSCLMTATSAIPQTESAKPGLTESIEAEYESLLESFDIF